jgi:hypothetical protein
LYISAIVNAPDAFGTYALLDTAVHCCLLTEALIQLALLLLLPLPLLLTNTQKLHLYVYLSELRTTMDADHTEAVQRPANQYCCQSGYRCTALVHDTGEFHRNLWILPRSSQVVNDIINSTYRQASVYVNGATAAQNVQFVKWLMILLIVLTVRRQLT